MVVSLRKGKKAIALLLVAAILMGTAYAGVETVRKKIFPRMYSEYVEKYLDKILVTVRVLFFRNVEELLALIKD